MEQLRSGSRRSYQNFNETRYEQTFSGRKVFLSAEVEIFQPEYSPNCEPERLHHMVEWIYRNDSYIGRKASMQFTNRGILFEEQVVDVSDQIASTTLYKIKHVKGLWVDPIFRPHVAIVIRCSRSSLLVFVVRILNKSMNEVVESFHMMKNFARQNAYVSSRHHSDQIQSANIKDRNRLRHVESRQSNQSRVSVRSCSSEDNYERHHKFRSSSTNVRGHSSHRNREHKIVKRAKSKVENNLNDGTISPNKIKHKEKRDRSAYRNKIKYARSPSTSSHDKCELRPSVTAVKTESISITNNTSTVTSKRASMQSANSSSPLDGIKYKEQNCKDLSIDNSSQTLHTNDICNRESYNDRQPYAKSYINNSEPQRTIDDCFDKSGEYSSINSQCNNIDSRKIRTNDDTSRSEDQSGQNNIINNEIVQKISKSKNGELESKHSGESRTPIDALFRELHVVREQLEQLKGPPENERLYWFESGMEQMKAELRQIRSKLDNCIITRRNDDHSHFGHLPASGNNWDCNETQRIVKITSSLNLKREFDQNTIRNEDTSALNDVAGEYENVNYLKKVGKLPTECDDYQKDEKDSRLKSFLNNKQKIKQINQKYDHRNSPHIVVRAPLEKNKPYEHQCRQTLPTLTFNASNSGEPETQLYNGSRFESHQIDNREDAQQHRQAPDSSSALSFQQLPSVVTSPSIVPPLLLRESSQSYNNDQLLQKSANHYLIDDQQPALASQQNQASKTSHPVNGNIPFMTPFFANRLTNPMFTNNNSLLVNTLANQFGLLIDSPELMTIVNDQSRYFSGRRTFANIIWNMSPEEESILRTKSPSPSIKLQIFNPATNTRRPVVKGNLQVNGIIAKKISNSQFKKPNKNVTFSIAERSQ
ncbi:hypothetical protein GJ496_005653 [Pomphorhynchus laevis]|nr:hypothetical protein GJ496_005653 [Pomphorhynchus laevis]